MPSNVQRLPANRRKGQLFLNRVNGHGPWAAGRQEEFGLGEGLHQIERGVGSEFAKEKGLTFDILHDLKNDVMTQFLVRGVPETFLISRAGTIVGSRYVTDWASAESRALVDSLLLAPRR